MFASTSPKAFSGVSPHVTKRNRLGKDGVVFPLKRRYDESNITLEGVEAQLAHHDPHAPLFVEPSGGAEGPVFGAPDNWLDPFDPSAEDSAPETDPSSAGIGASSAARPSAGIGAPLPSEGPDPERKEEEKGALPTACIDSLGRVYPIDVYGNIIRKTRRPYGAPAEEWANASSNHKKHVYRSFRRCAPDGRAC